jgi:NO-binding membrane sensor protein with MHYT domain
MARIGFWCDIIIQPLGERIILGGCVAGSGVILTHYISMMGMEFRGNMVYNSGVVALSVLMAMSSLVVGYIVFFSRTVGVSQLGFSSCCMRGALRC